MSETVYDEDEDFFEKVNETDLYDVYANEKLCRFLGKDNGLDYDKNFESLPTQLNNALRSQNCVPVARISDSSKNIPKPKLQSPPRCSTPLIVASRINDIDNAIEIEYDLEKDYKALEPAVDFPETVSYVRLATPSLITPNRTALNSNTSSSCFIDATFELLWHCVLPWVADSIFKKNQLVASTNEFDKILYQTYMLHSSGTLEGRLDASSTIREFVWSLRNYKKGEWNDCNQLLGLFLDNLSPDIRSFCSFSDAVRFKQCTAQEFHNIYAISRIPYFSFTSDFKKIIYRKATVACQTCIEQNRGKENGTIGRLICRNILDDNTSYPPFLFLCNGADFTSRGNESNEEIPTTICIENYFYQLHGRVYATSSRGEHFYSVGIVQEPNNLASTNTRRLAETTDKIDEILSKKLNTVYVCYKKQ